MEAPVSEVHCSEAAREGSHPGDRGASDQPVSSAPHHRDKELMRFIQFLQSPAEIPKSVNDGPVLSIVLWWHFSPVLMCFSHLRFKNVMFDISPTEEVGDFEVKAKFMGVEMEKVQLHFQVKTSQHVPDTKRLTGQHSNLRS